MAQTEEEVRAALGERQIKAQQLRPFVQPGDHLAVDRGFYTHHGVFVERSGTYPAVLGNRAAGVQWCGHGVVHYVKSLGKNGALAVTPLADFIGDSKSVAIVVHEDTGRLPLGEIQHRALSNVGLDVYGLTDHNCEHFSTWCVTGHWRSIQVERVTSVAAFTAGLIHWSLGAGVAVAAVAAKDRAAPLTECQACEQPHPWTLLATGSHEDLTRAVLRLRQRDRANQPKHFDGAWVEVVETEDGLVEVEDLDAVVDIQWN